jgi:hypothetical protein
MIESRCGVCCNSCEHKEEWGCKGCLQMMKPTWGECEVKLCCEGKELNFCGECSDFPCEILSNMGKEFGYDTSIKIEQCRIWMKDQKNE